jgi:uncharacterized protein (DUF1499 family)
MKKRSGGKVIFMGIIALVLTAGALAEPARATALKPCPDSPNCVSSQSPGEKHHIAPFPIGSSPGKAYRSLIDILGTLKRVRIVGGGDGHIHAEFSSRIFGFVDDVDFLFEPETGVIHVRSASRTGYYDFGANRKRIEHIRKLFTSALGL